VKPAVRSLRQRLFVVILLPLVLMAILLGYWRYTVALDTADQLYDRSLLAAALAISRDVSKSEGDALTPWTRDLIKDAAGEDVFYHMSGPAGAYLTGYAYPPIAPKSVAVKRDLPVFFESTYRGEAVRVLQLTEHSSTEFLAGDTTVTVWQPISVRNQFARQLAFRALALISALLATLSVVVWFGVQVGLRPLTDLQQAIAIRSADDLSTIKRAIPVEAHGIVATLNRLFGQVVTSLNAHQVFISDAAHQLRNPAAAVLSMAEAVRDAGSDDERDRRVQEMISAAKASSRVADQLLSLDRLRQGKWSDKRSTFDLSDLTRQVCADLAANILSTGVDFDFFVEDEQLPVFADRVIVSEALKNLVDNAQKHSGPGLTKIEVETTRQGDYACVTVSDDGVGLKPADEAKAFSRFGQIEPSTGSGLGLAIVHSVAESHAGSLKINAVERGASISLCLPVTNSEN